MTNLPYPLLRDEIDRFCELASVGAELAAAALGQLLGYRVRSRAPRVCGADDPAEAPQWCTGIIFEAGGDMAGIVAIVLPATERDRAVEQMVGRPDADRDIAESALRELGNIIASQTVSAIADSLDTTILLSVPTLVMDGTGGVLRSLASQRGGSIRIETELGGPDGSVKALLVLAPDAVKADVS
jgi:chemotaxis protein CheC